MDHAAIIQRLGGNTYVGERLGLHRTSVSRWATFGIPSGYYVSLIALANEQGMRLTMAQLAAGHPRHGKQAVEQVLLLPERSEPRINIQAKKVTRQQAS
jgi:hypothetical protein